MLSVETTEEQDEIVGEAQENALQVLANNISAVCELLCCQRSGVVFVTLIEDTAGQAYCIGAQFY